MMFSTTAVTVTNLCPDDVRLSRDPMNSSSLSSIAVGAVHLDLTAGWTEPDRTELIAALEKLARISRQAAHELRKEDQRGKGRPS